jgi:2-C-methyl-D-erythritol 4-phosphate cytidylyltransferase
VRRRSLLVTDDTAACELIGQPVQLVLSTQPNPKVTCPEDLPYVEALLHNLTRSGAPGDSGRRVL